MLDKGLPHIRQHPDTVIVIDHLGLLQPARPPVPADVWADLPKLDGARAAVTFIRERLQGVEASAEAVALWDKFSIA